MFLNGAKELLKAEEREGLAEDGIEGGGDGILEDCSRPRGRKVVFWALKRPGLGFDLEAKYLLVHICFFSWQIIVCSFVSLTLVNLVD